MTSVKAVALRVSELLMKQKITRYQLCRKIAMPEITLMHILHEDNKRIYLDTIHFTCFRFWYDGTEIFWLCLI